MSEIKISEDEMIDSIILGISSLKEELLRSTKALERIEKQVYIAFPKKKPAPKKKSPPTLPLSEKASLEIFDLLVDALQDQREEGFLKVVEKYSDKELIEVSFQIGAETKTKSRNKAIDYIKRKAQERMNLSFPSAPRTNS